MATEVYRLSDYPEIGGVIRFRDAAKPGSLLARKVPEFDAVVKSYWVGDRGDFCVITNCGWFIIVTEPSVHLGLPKHVLQHLYRNADPTVRDHIINHPNRKLKP